MRSWLAAADPQGKDGAVPARALRRLAPLAAAALLAACGATSTPATLAGAKGIDGSTTTVAGGTTTLVPAPDVEVPATLTALYERLTDSLRGLGGTYHAVRTRSAPVGGTTRTEVWVDVTRGLGKAVSPAGTVGQAAAAPCYGAPPEVTLVLDCTKVLHDNGSVAISGARRDGRAVVLVQSSGGALPTEGTDPELAGRYVRTVELDAATMLPLRIDVRGDAIGEVPLSVDATTEFVWDVLPAASLPDAFFAPS